MLSRKEQRQRLWAWRKIGNREKVYGSCRLLAPQILRCLDFGTMTIEGLVQDLGHKYNRVWKALNIMRQLGLVERRSDGWVAL